MQTGKPTDEEKIRQESKCIYVARRGDWPTFSKRSILTEQELKLSTKLIKNYASQPDAEQKIELLLESLFACYPQEQKDSLSVQKNAEQISSVITFTQKEIQKMQKTFKKEFIANGLCAHILKRVRYKGSVSYLIRYRRNGYCIIVYGATIEDAKKNFVKATLPENIEKYRKKEAKIANLVLYSFNPSFAV